MHFHAVVALVAFVGLVHLKIPLLLLFLSPPANSAFTLVGVELGAGMMLATMVVPCFIVIPLAMRCYFTASKIC